MTLDCWFVDTAIKQNILQRIGNEGHSVLKLLLMTIPLILHPFFPSCKLQQYPYLSFL